MSGRALFVLAALLAGVAPARALPHGPTCCEVLGWSPAEKRVYVRETPPGAEVGVVRGFDLAGADPTAARELPAATPRSLAALRARLRPLEAVPAPALPEAVRLAAMDTLRLVTMQEYPRMTLRVTLAAAPPLPTFEVTAFGSTQVVCLGLWRVPGRDERLVVLAFKGDPEQGGFETQVPVLVRGGEGGTRKVAWGAYGE